MEPTTSINFHQNMLKLSSKAIKQALTVIFIKTIISIRSVLQLKKTKYPYDKHSGNKKAKIDV